MIGSLMAFSIYVSLCSSTCNSAYALENQLLILMTASSLGHRKAIRSCTHAEIDFFGSR